MHESERSGEKDNIPDVKNAVSHVPSSFAQHSDFISLFATSIAQLPGCSGTTFLHASAKWKRCLTGRAESGISCDFKTHQMGAGIPAMPARQNGRKNRAFIRQKLRRQSVQKWCAFNG
jgi:hypothetical protein